jgi:hypothetical protein
MAKVPPPLVAFQHQRLRVAAEDADRRVDGCVDAAADDDLAVGAGRTQRVLATRLVRPVGVQKLVGELAAVGV